MSAASPSVGLVLGVLALASLVASLASALIFGTQVACARLGQGRSVALGLAAAGLGTFALLLLLDPDPVARPEPFEDYARRTFVSAGFCTIFWLPLFLTLRGLLLRSRT